MSDEMKDMNIFDRITSPDFYVGMSPTEFLLTLKRYNKFFVDKEDTVSEKEISVICQHLRELLLIFEAQFSAKSKIIDAELVKMRQNKNNESPQKYASIFG